MDGGKTLSNLNREIDEIRERESACSRETMQRDSLDEFHGDKVLPRFVS